MRWNRFIDRVLLLIGIACLGTYVVYTVQAKIYQDQLDASFEEMAKAVPPDVPKKSSPPPPLILKEGDLVGRLEIPRLDLSVMVMEGVSSRTLRLGAGHIPGTAFPGAGSNTGIAAHRDSFFRALSKIQPEDQITFRTPKKTIRYRVTSTEIVKPDDVTVLSPTNDDSLTLVTCYPFYYIGPAPKRFVVKAAVDSNAVSQ